MRVKVQKLAWRRNAICISYHFGGCKKRRFCRHTFCCTVFRKNCYYKVCRNVGQSIQECNSIGRFQLSKLLRFYLKIVTSCTFQHFGKLEEHTIALLGAIFSKPPHWTSFTAIYSGETRNTNTGAIYRWALSVIFAVAYLLAVFTVSQHRALPWAIFAAPTWFTDTLTCPRMTTTKK